MNGNIAFPSLKLPNFHLSIPQKPPQYLYKYRETLLITEKEDYPSIFLFKAHQHPNLLSY